MRYVYFILGFYFLLACESSTKQTEIHKAETILTLKYAKGFKVDVFKNHKIVSVIKPWPKAEKIFQYLIIDSLTTTTKAINKAAFDAVVLPAVKKIIVTSTTHIPALELLGKTETLVGFPGTDYISSVQTRQRIARNAVTDLGQNNAINTEVALSLNPDVVIGFGIDGINTTFETLQKAKIPILYNGDWAEDSPLAKAEWIKFFGAIFNTTKKADSIFNTIENNYNTAKTLASKVKTQPTVLSGALHNNVWYMPNGKSPEAQLLKDANVNYLWQHTTENGSLALSFETVFAKAAKADLWLNPSYYTSLKQLQQANDLYTNFKAFKTENVYGIAATTGEKGGVLYYELGVARPDLVLKDIINICHPNILPNYTPVFYKPL